MPPGFSPNGLFVVEGRGGDPDGAHYRLVGGDYFATMGIAVRRGRVFTADDDESRPTVAVVNETLARLIFPGDDPIGHAISMPGMDGATGTATIVGIVEDVRHRGPAAAPVPETYFSYRQRPRRTFAMTLIVDATTGDEATAAMIRERTRAIDPLVPPELTSMAALLAPFVEPSAFRARLLGVVSAIALVLALGGIAGVVAHAAARRRHEMGIRAALGAQPASLLRLVIGAAMRPVLIGAAAGAAGAFAAARLLNAFLFDVSPRDPGAMIFAVMAVLGAGLIASWWPARRSSQVDPASVLRV
jgi:putative ABC transport system permease protein